MRAIVGAFGATSLVWSIDLRGGVKVLHAGWPGDPGLLDNCLSNCPYTFGDETEDRGYEYRWYLGARRLRPDSHDHLDESAGSG